MFNAVCNSLHIGSESVGYVSTAVFNFCIIVAVVSLLLFATGIVAAVRRKDCDRIKHYVKAALYLPENGNPLHLKDGERLPRVDCIDEDMMAPARYTDKAIAADLYIIMSPYAPNIFYKYSDVDTFDGFDQLRRRIITTICTTQDEIIRMSWDDDKGGYYPVDGSNVPNLYSSKNYPSTEADAENTYAAIISVKGEKP